MRSSSTTRREKYQRPLSSLIPYIPRAHMDNFMVYFSKLDRKQRGYVSGSAIGRYFRKSGLGESVLAQVWDLSDVDNDGRLRHEEFCIAMHLINCMRQGAPLPTRLPDSLDYRLTHGGGGDEHYLRHRANTEPDAAGLQHIRRTLQRKKLKTHKDKDARRKGKGKGTSSRSVVPSSSWPHFAAHMQLTELAQLRVSDFVDFRRGDGKSVSAQIVDFRPAARGWRLARIERLDEQSGQARVDGYWVHLDNHMEASPAKVHSLRRARVALATALRSTRCLRTPTRS